MKIRFFKSPVSLAYAICFIFLSFCFIATLIIRYRLIWASYPDIGGIESNVIYSIQRFLGGFSLYSHPELSPYPITQYSPLYYRIVSWVCVLFKLNPDNPLEIYQASRTVSLLFNICYCITLFSLARMYKLKSIIAFAIAIMAFVIFPPQFYSRPDSLSSLFTILTLLSLSGYALLENGRGQQTWLIVALFLSALAIATKQSAAVLPLIIGSYILLIEKKFLKAVSAGIVMSLLTLLFLYLFMPEHNLKLLYLNTVVGVKQGIDWNLYMINIYQHYFRPYILTNVLGLIFSVWLLFQNRPAYKVLGWFVLVLFSFSLLTSLKQGSALNYFTEFVTLSPLLGMLYIKEFLGTQMKLPKIYHAFILVFGIAMTVPNIPNLAWKIALKKDALNDYNYQEQKKIADYLSQNLGMKDKDAVFVTFHNYCFLNGLLYKNCILPQQEISLVMYPKDDIDYTLLKEQIAGNKIRFIITTSGEKSIEFPGISLDNYELKKSFNEFDVYEIRTI